MITPLINFIIYYLCELGFIVLNWVEVFLNISNNMLFSIRTSSPAFLTLLNYLKDAFVVFLQMYNTLFTMRFVLMWFPNINPFIQPYYIIYTLTEPPIKLIRDYVKPMFGIDFSFIICSYAIFYLTVGLIRFKF